MAGSDRGPGPRPGQGRGVRRGARGRRWQWMTAGVASIALIAGAIVANGFDVTQTPQQDDTVWALQSQGERYGQVDTSLGELESVNSVRNPSALVQTESQVLLYAQNDAEVARVDPAKPVDLTSAGDGFDSTPGGTTRLVSTGQWVGYLTADGAIYVGDVAGGGQTSPVRINAPDGADAADAADGPGAERGSYSADAIAIGSDGILYSYSHAAGAVARYDIRRGRVVGTDALPGGPTAAGVQLTVVGDDWVLADATGARMWIRGHAGAITTGLGKDARVQQPSAAHASVVVADGQGAYAFELGDGSRAVLTRGAGDAASAAGAELGVPAAPYWSGSTLMAAWLSRGAGTLYQGNADRRGAIIGEATTLGFGGRTTTSDPVPVFRGNGSATILNDTQSGWVWLAPSGALVASSQQWEQFATQNNTGTRHDGPPVQSNDPKAPVAVDDAFGVRADSIVALPVLLNDYDPNQSDVLTIRPGSVKGLPAAFGTASITDGGQTITVDVAPGATGSATLQYMLTDGTAADGGLYSHVATVTLTVHPPGVDAAPQWCPVAGCTQPRPALQVAPGGTVGFEALTGWVDPDGDPMFVASASLDPTTPIGNVSVTPDGHLVYQHPDANASDGEVRIDLVVSDVEGRTTAMPLEVTVTPKPTLSITPFGVQTDAGEHVTVDPSSHVVGVAGTAAITSATIPAGSRATVVVDQSGTSFDFMADAPGSYPVTMTMADAQSTATSIVRVTVLPADSRLLTTAPVTVFVRPQADTSVDVFSAVSNPSGAVLLLQAQGSPRQAEGASLYADVVGQNQLRVRGSRSDGQAGLLGTVDYVVSDGSPDAAMRVHGRATVYLLPESQGATPIAIDDAVTVRAGAQLDIPVLANDVAPDGNQLVLDPTSVSAPKGGGLAFASSRVLRYLAPRTAQTVVLRYAVYAAGYPQKRDTATVTVTVLPTGGNRPPHPQTLTGRVLSGRTVSIPFDGYGLDPDGDTVSLDRVVSQPAHGTAALSAAGDAIEYTSTAPYSGADEFSYQVRDGEGDVGVALVRVGVLAGSSDPAPIAFSDYVQVQAGAGNQVVVHPTANDVDPAGSPLTLGTVAPDAPKGTAEYARLAGQLSLSHDDKGAVIVAAPATADQRTLTYTYQVANANGDQSEGLIVVRVVTQPVPDYPIVADTVVPAQDRAQLGRGVDVVTGKVSWTSGDAGDLTLSLWGAPKGVSVTGHRIVARVGDNGLLVPFELSGTSFSGAKVVSYGFLRVPPLSAVILALKTSTPPVPVTENGTASFAMSSLVAVPQGAVLQVDDHGVKASGARHEAQCTASGDRIEYAAGGGAPWTDSCTVPVRIAGQSQWTLLAVPIAVTALEPKPTLGTGSVTASPGTEVVYDLAKITDWPGHSGASGLSYSVVASAAVARQFTLTLDGSKLHVSARDTAVPGTELHVPITLIGRSDVAAGSMTLKVGPAPSTLPAGATVPLQCSESKGSDCTIQVIGRPGEVNPYPSTPLVLAGITAVSGCPGVSFRVVDATSIRASWTAGTAGGSCEARFSVRDAQGRLSGSSRDGSLQFELQGYPQAPASVVQSGYGDGSVTLTVDPGAATAAYPALQGFTIELDGKQIGGCDVTGNCGPITGLSNGDQRVFTVFARNAVGLSAASVTTTAWAYSPPGMGSVSAASVYDPSRTTASSGAVTVTIGNSDSSTTGYEITLNGKDAGPTPKSSGATTTRIFTEPVGPVDVAVTPVSQYPRPPVQGASAQAVHTTALAVGSPSVTWRTTPALTTTNSSITVGSGIRFNAAQSPLDGQKLYAATGVGAGAPCTIDGSGGGLGATRATATSSSSTISGLDLGGVYDVWVCFSNGFGVDQQQVGTVTVWQAPDAPAGVHYVIAACDAAAGAACDDVDYALDEAATAATAAPPSGYEAVFAGLDTAAAAYGQDLDGLITVAYCLRSDATLCGASAPVTAASGSPTMQLRLNASDVALQCTVVDGAAQAGLSIAGAGVAGANPAGYATDYDYVHPVVDSSTDPPLSVPTVVHGSATTDAPILISDPAFLPPDATHVTIDSWLLHWQNGGLPDFSSSRVLDADCG